MTPCRSRSALSRAPLPGALTFRGRGDVPALRRLLDELSSGTARSVAVTLTSERMWSLPAYELAVMTASHLRERGCDATVWLVTPEQEPLELFGPAAARAIEPTFPLKQGGLAAQQADAAAEAIAARLGAPIVPQPFQPILRGLLMTSGSPLYLRAEPQRQPRQSTVAIDAGPRRHAIDASTAAGQPLWWPPAKIAGRYLAPWLATARPQPLSRELLADRVPVPGPPVSEAEQHDALALALLLADYDARWGDYGSALNALAAAQALQGALPPEYEAKRRAWRAAARGARVDAWDRVT